MLNGDGWFVQWMVKGWLEEKEEEEEVEEAVVMEEDVLVGSVIY